MAVTLTSAMLAAGRVDGFPVYDGKSLEICTVSNGTTTCSVVPAIKDPEEALENKLFGGLNATELNKALDGLLSSSQSQVRCCPLVEWVTNIAHAYPVLKEERLRHITCV